MLSLLSHVFFAWLLWKSDHVWPRLRPLLIHDSHNQEPVVSCNGIWGDDASMAGLFQLNWSRIRQEFTSCLLKAYLAYWRTADRFVGFLAAFGTTSYPICQPIFFFFQYTLRIYRQCWRISLLELWPFLHSGGFFRDVCVCWRFDPNQQDMAAVHRLTEQLATWMAMLGMGRLLAHKRAQICTGYVSCFHSNSAVLIWWLNKNRWWGSSISLVAFSEINGHQGGRIAFLDARDLSSPWYIDDDRDFISLVIFNPGMAIPTDIILFQGAWHQQIWWF